jgi:hypothetical protein
LLQRDIAKFEDQLQENEEHAAIDQLGPSLKRRKLSHTSINYAATASPNPSKNENIIQSTKATDISAVSTLKHEALEQNLVLNSESAFPRVERQSEWDLPPTLQQDFMRHQPINFFSEGISTIPDNTREMNQLAEQTALAEYGNRTPNMNDARLSSEVKSSLPWSDILRAQSEMGSNTGMYEEVGGTQGQLLGQNNAEDGNRVYASNTQALVSDLRVGDQAEITYTPPGTPERQCELTSEPFARKASNPRVSKPAKRQSKKKKNPKIEDSVQSEDELAMANEETITTTNSIKRARGGRNTEIAVEKSTPESISQAPSPNVTVAIPYSKHYRIDTTTDPDPSTSASIREKISIEQQPLHLDKPEASTDTEAASDTSVTRTRRGRARQRKVQLSKDMATGQESPPIIEPIKIEDTSHTSSILALPLGEISANQIHEKKNESLQETKMMATEAKTESVPDEKENPTPKKASAPQNSASFNGRAPYRVGLSKRTRIAPLLRVFRK